MSHTEPENRIKKEMPLTFTEWTQENTYQKNEMLSKWENTASCVTEELVLSLGKRRFSR